MKHSQPGFVIDTIRNIVVAETYGHWDLLTDYRYLSALGEAMNLMRGNPWYVFVDMRNWHVPDEVIHSQHKSDVVLNRSNQMSECWLVNNPSQGEYVVPYFEKAKVPLHRTTEISGIDSWLSQHGLPVSAEFLLDTLYVAKM